MILHFSHIGLTDGRTFMVPFGWITRAGGSGDRCGRRYHPPAPAVARLNLACPRARPSRIAKRCVRRRPSGAARSHSLGGVGRSLDGALRPVATAPPEPGGGGRLHPVAATLLGGVE